MTRDALSQDNLTSSAEQPASDDRVTETTQITQVLNIQYPDLKDQRLCATLNPRGSGAYFTMPKSRGL